MNHLQKNDIISLFENTETLLTNQHVRETVMEQLKELDFPTRKTEEWRHTDISPLLDHNYRIGTKDKANTDIENYVIDPDSKNRLFFIDGYYCSEISKIADTGKLIVKNSKEVAIDNKALFEKYFNTVSTDKNLFATLNTAFSQDGTFIFVKSNSIIDTPVEIIHLFSGERAATLSNLRNLVIAEENSQIKIIERNDSLQEGTTLSNISTEVVLKPNARVDYHILQGKNDNSYQINRLSVNQEKSSVFNCHTITLCGGIVRNELNINMLDEHCEASANGLYIAKNHQHTDNYVLVNHMKPNCVSYQDYRGIIDNDASAVFFGKIYVNKDAQKTDANQSNKNVVLSKTGKVNSKPQLEIYADDVKCSHGSTTGQLNEDEIFYMRTRGISEKDARSMQLLAFVQDNLTKITIEKLREALFTQVVSKLEDEQTEHFCMDYFQEACVDCKYKAK